MTTRKPCRHHWKMTTVVGGLKLYHCAKCGDYYGKHAEYGWKTMYEICDIIKHKHPLPWRTRNERPTL